MKPLIHFLQLVPDHRSRQGLRYPFHPFVSMIILAHISGYYGLNEISRFIRFNQEYFKKTFNLSAVPGYTIIRTFCARVKFEAINEAFYQWASQYIEQDEWLSIDAKSLGSTSSEAFSVNQNFKSLVSVFSHKSGIVLRSEHFENKTTSEIHCVQDILAQLEQRGMILTLDAMHCQKKPSKPSWIVEMSM